jgi:nucleotide-binding universal stress UspA family protein
MKRILIPTDFSENSWNAIKYAMAFFKNTECDFYFLHVTLISSYGASEFPLFPSTDVIDTTLLKQGKTALKSLVKKLEKHYSEPGYNFYLINTYNYFIDAIREQIKEKDIDLIVMGTKGASGLSEIIVGSNTGDLITQVRCPVLIIPEKAVFEIPEEIAFPTDYNIFHPSAILNYIDQFVKTYNSAIRILHVAKKDEELTEFQLENKALLHDFFINKKHSFHRITNKKIEAGVQCFVESRNINLIVMVAKNVNLFQRILFRPTVEEISYHIEIPFLVLHEHKS